MKVSTAFGVGIVVGAARLANGLREWPNMRWEHAESSHAGLSASGPNSDTACQLMSKHLQSSPGLELGLERLRVLPRRDAGPRLECA